MFMSSIVNFSGDVKRHVSGRLAHYFRAPYDDRDWQENRDFFLDRQAIFSVLGTFSRVAVLGFTFTCAVPAILPEREHENSYSGHTKEIGTFVRYQNTEMHPE